jgi:hypothetical protein
VNASRGATFCHETAYSVQPTFLEHHRDLEMDAAIDFVIFDETDAPVLLVESKSRCNRSADWASRMRRNLVRHGSLPSAPFFMIVLPDRIFLWKDSNSSEISGAPSRIIDASPIFDPYFDRAGVKKDTISGASFELIVGTWLNRLVHDSSDLDTKISYKPNHWIVESGLLPSIQNGRVQQQAVASNTASNSTTARSSIASMTVSPSSEAR